MNKHGIPVQTKIAQQQRMDALEDKRSGMKRFVLIDDEANVEVVVPYFSPIIELLEGDGWREIT